MIVSLQQTPLDGKATLRIFSELDRFLHTLCKILAVEVTNNTSSAKITHSATVPYDANGQLSGTVMVSLNLNQGQKIRLNCGHDRSCVGRVIRYCSTQQAWELEIDGVKMLLGFWWLGAARAGGPKFLPILNVNCAGNCH